MSENRFSVGYGQVDISPKESVPLRGYGNTSRRMSNNIQDPLYATAVAITDKDNNTAILFAMDLTGLSEAVIAPIREAISTATGVPFCNIMSSCSHNHSAPDYDNTAIPSIPRYLTMLKFWMVEAAQKAMADRLPAEMYINSTETKGLNFIRRYILENGTAAGDNYGDFNASPIAGYESEMDRTLQLVKFVREGGKDVIIANFQGHPHRAGGSRNPNVTSDLVGVFRDELQKELGVLAAYFTGGSGNANCHSRIPEENITKDYREHGKALAAYAIACEGSYKKVETGRVQVNPCNYIANINHTQDHKVPIATEIYKEWVSTGDHTAAVKKCVENGMNSPYHAGAIISRSKMPPTGSFSIYALSIGDVAFVTAPYEMFDTSGSYIKANSPFEMTMVLTCANGSQGYFPSLLGWKNGGYSVDTTRFEMGTAEKVAEKYVELLKELYPTK